MQQLINVMQLLIRRRMQHNNHTPNQACRAPHPAQHPQSLMQNITPQHRPDQHRQRSQRRHQYRGRESICRKIPQLANNHRDHASPPYGILEVCEAVALEAMACCRRVEPGLCDDEGGADAEAAYDGERQADVFVLHVGLCVRPSEGVLVWCSWGG